MSVTAGIARTILDGFDKHYRILRASSAGARDRFERADWAAAWEANRARIDGYDVRVREAVTNVLARYPEARDDKQWPQIKQAYIALLYDHLQPECAETFFNSVACRLLSRTYYNNAYIFWRPAVSTEHLAGTQPTYRTFYPASHGFLRTLREIVRGFGLALPFEDLSRDLGRVVRALRAHFPSPREVHPNFQIQVLSSLFFRNKAAYVIGRAINGHSEYPFAVPILQTDRRQLYLDALLLEPGHIAALFSLARAYFMVDMEVPSAWVSFLSSLMPAKPRAELYTSVGLQKQGKTLFYRDLMEHLLHSTDQFVLAPGTRGMVMLVFTLPSFPYVFKVIRDWFAPPKDTSVERVKEKYLLVKHHDRVGRMADTLEYSDVAFPADRFDAAVVAELERLAPSRIERDGDRLVIKHLYIERRMIPLDVYLRGAGEDKLRHGVKEYGDAISELAAANIFPGDLLLKNFGVTRFGRVVFYDYDEICYLTECNFRRIPPPRDFDEEMSAEPWFSVGPHDVFPEEFPRFLFSQPRAEQLFLEMHPQIVDAGFWTQKQRRIRAGQYEDLFPYPRSLRFSERFAAASPALPEHAASP